MFPLHSLYRNRQWIFCAWQIGCNLQRRYSPTVSWSLGVVFECQKVSVPDFFIANEDHTILADCGSIYFHWSLFRAIQYMHEVPFMRSSIVLQYMYMYVHVHIVHSLYMYSFLGYNSHLMQYNICSYVRRYIVHYFLCFTYNISKIHCLFNYCIIIIYIHVCMYVPGRSLSDTGWTLLPTTTSDLNIENRTSTLCQAYTCINKLQFCTVYNYTV